MRVTSAARRTDSKTPAKVRETLRATVDRYTAATSSATRAARLRSSPVS